MKMILIHEHRLNQSDKHRSDFTVVVKKLVFDIKSNTSNISEVVVTLFQVLCKNLIKENDHFSLEKCFLMRNQTFSIILSSYKLN